MSSRPRRAPARVIAMADAAVPGRNEGRSSALLLSAVLLVSLLFRIPVLSTERLWPDEALYAQIARDFIADPASILRTEAYSEHLPIVVVLLSLGLVFTNSLAGLRVMTLLINLLGILATYKLGEKIAGPFVGLCAAVFIAVNVGYFHHSHLILIDGPFAVAHVGLALALLNVRAEPRWDRRDLVVGLTAIGVALLKWYAALMIGPIVILYYLVACKDLPLIQRLKKLLLPLSCLAIVAAPYLLWKAEVLRQQGGVVSYFQRPAFYYLLTAPTFVGGVLSLCVVLVGAFFLFRQAAPRIQALVAAVIVVELAVMSLAPEKDGRYILPVLPFVAFVYALGIDGLINALVKKKALRAGAHMVVLGLLSLQFIPFFLNANRTYLTTIYTGFTEAGEAMRGLVSPDAMILAGSVRAMRYAGGREHAHRVRELPPTIEGLRTLVQQHRGRIILETDRWEYTQPSWVFPWSNAKVESLGAIGFRQAALISRPVGSQVQPVILVLARD